MMRKRESLLAVLSAIVLLSMGSNVIAAMFCPHVSGQLSCLMQKPNSHSHAGMTNIESAKAHGHMTHAQMSDMQMDDMNMSDMQMPVMIESHSKACGIKQLETPMRASPTPDTRLPTPDSRLFTAPKVVGDAVTQESDSCSHCIMHSQPGGAVSATIIVPGSNTSNAIALECCAEIVEPVVSLHSPQDLHDHGPPGAFGPRYVLNSVFRI